MAMSAAVETAFEEVFSDFPAFCELLDIRSKSEGVIPFAYDRWYPEQRQFQRERTGFDIVIKPRQVGFSTIELARDLWYAIMHPGAQVLVVTHDGEMKDQLFLTVRLMSDSLREQGLLRKTRYSTKTEIVFADDGAAVRIVEAGETQRAADKKGRSGTVHRLHATEVAFWGAPEVTMGAVLGSLSDTCEVVIESTANGVGGMFYHDVQAALEGRSRYRLHFFPWYRHSAYRAPVVAAFDPKPRDEWEARLRAEGCDDEQIQWWRHRADDEKFGLEKALQEYPVDIRSCFRSPEGVFIKAEYIDAIAGYLRDPVEKFPLRFNGNPYGEALIYTRPTESGSYVIGADISEGTGNDGNAAVVLDRSTGETVATVWSDTTEPGDFGLALVALGTHYNHAMLAPERNNHGHTTVRAIMREGGYRNVYQCKDNAYGWDTNTATRPPLWDELAGAIRSCLAFTPDTATLEECRTLVRVNGRPAALNKGAKGGCKDDRYVAWAIAWQVRAKSVNTEIVTGLPRSTRGLFDDRRSGGLRW
jgi:hypothetical protein